MSEPAKSRATSQANSPAAAAVPLLIDTREQTPLDFAHLAPEISATRRTVFPGDYTIAGLEQLYAVERKGVSRDSADIVGTITQLLRGERGKGNAAGGSLRFLRELAAMGAINRNPGAPGLAYVAITRPRAWFASHQYRSELSPAALFAKLASLEARFGVPFVYFANDFELRDRIANEARHIWRKHLRDAIAATAGDLTTAGFTGVVPRYRVLSTPKT